MLIQNTTIGKNVKNSWQILLLLFVICFFLSHTSQSQSKDTLFFYNKTRVVGELIQIKLGRIEFDADNIGVVKIKNTKVESIHASSRSFRVETLDGEELQGYLMR